MQAIVGKGANILMFDDNGKLMSDLTARERRRARQRIRSHRAGQAKNQAEPSRLRHREQHAAARRLTILRNREAEKRIRDAKNGDIDLAS